MTITPGTLTLTTADGEAGALADLSAALPFPAYDELRRFLFARLFERQDDLTLSIPRREDVDAWINSAAKDGRASLVIPANLGGFAGALLLTCERSEATHLTTWRVSAHT